MTDEEMRTTLEQFQQQAIQKLQTQMKKRSSTKCLKRASFFAANKNKLGVKTLADGLQYKILQEGEGKGASPSLNNMVTVNYEGRLLDATYCICYKRGNPATFPVKERL